MWLPLRSPFSVNSCQGEGIYKTFPTSFWDRKEPIALRPSEAVRQERFVRRFRPTFSHPLFHWVIVRHNPTNSIVGCAAWVAPGNPVHEHFRKDAVDFYGWRDQYNCSDEEFEELWSHVDDKAWTGHLADTDAVRKEVLGDEPHWFLASLYTLPEWQGNGVGKLLLNWAIRQADATEPVTPLYLESSPAGRPVYMRAGFVPQGETNMLRRGPAVVMEKDTKAADGPTAATTA
jgi:GNAT superfamily N-acetyltransferase